MIYFLFFKFIFASHLDTEIRIALIDTGFDANHEEIRESYANGYDFADNDSEIIDWKFFGLCNDICKNYGTLHFKRRNLVATEDELKQLGEIEKNQPEVPGLFAQFLTFFHGTAIASIATKATSNVKWYGYKMMKMEEIEIGYNDLPEIKNPKPRPTTAQIKEIVQQEVLRWGEMFENIALKIAEDKIRLVNNSYFVNRELFIGRIDKQIRLRYQHVLDRKDLNAIGILAYMQFLGYAETMITLNPDTVFFVGVPNSPINIDEEYYFPTHVKADNVIVVQASNGLDKASVFTARGPNTIELAAPGVDVTFASPGNEYYTASGTSAAVPYALNVAARMLEINPELSPKEIKDILIATARRFDFMKDLNKNSAIINPEKALETAKSYKPAKTF